MYVDKAIIVKNVSKKYKLYSNTRDRLFDLFIPGQYGDDFYALKSINFSANKGEVIGFVGINGSGKSTLSNIIAGIVPETSGTVKVNGQASLIAVAAGLKHDLTGRDNIELKLLMLGFNKKEIEELEPEIIEFSELEQFIDQPVKSYSSGMRSRLGFAISVSVDPDILIIDEALSVGDKAFSEKSLKKMKEFKDEGKTMIFVSHSLGQMKKFCDKILWLEFGRVKDYGEVNEVISKYETFLDVWKKMSKGERAKYKADVINNKIDMNKFLNEKQVEKTKKIKVVYSERLISRVGRFRANESFVYTSPKSKKEKKSTQNFRRRVYYIKKQATYNDELFYLLSREQSSQTGTIGWVKANDLVTHRHIQIDKDIKRFRMKGTGSAYNEPWGSDKNLVISNLKKYKNEEFIVEQTDRIGRRIWYYGTLANESVWINQKHLVTDDV